jgi:hypothetical protein
MRDLVVNPQRGGQVVMHRLAVVSRIAEAIANLDVATTSQAELLTWLATCIPGALHGNGSARPAGTSSGR